jgi:hypothetical protein
MPLVPDDLMTNTRQLLRFTSSSNPLPNDSFAGACVTAIISAARSSCITELQAIARLRDCAYIRERRRTQM